MDFLTPKSAKKSNGIITVPPRDYYGSTECYSLIRVVAYGNAWLRSIWGGDSPLRPSSHGGPVVSLSGSLVIL